MKYIAIISIAILLTACGGGKKIVSTPSTPETVSVVEEKVITKTPERTAPEVETDIIPAEKEEKTLPEVTDTKEEVVAEVEIPLEAFDHSNYNELLTQYVSKEGIVNYEGFKSNWGILRNYIKALGEQLPEDSWSQENQLAYWMNAYNAMTIDLILRNYPLSSIKDIKNPWDQRFWKLGEKYYNLNQIEHQILRKMGDARIHFGINCASFSCPPLLNEAFTAQKVDAQLDDLARRFINDTQRNTITANNIQVSKIFSWFAKDFKTDGSLIDFLNKYSETTISPKAKKKYKEYDWTLNN